MNDVQENLLQSSNASQSVFLKEFQVELSLDENGKGTIVTPLITGWLEYMLLQPQLLTRVLVHLQRFPSFELLNLNELSGERLFPIRMQPTDSTGHFFTFGVEKIPLNDSLVFNFRGSPGARVFVLLTWS